MIFNDGCIPDLREKIKDIQVFIETGTYMGHTVLKVKDYFREVHTIEIRPDWYKARVEGLSKFKNVYLYYGDSGELLYPIIKPIDERIVFWLDAHEGDWEEEPTPLLRELDAIKKHRLNNHVILIDDMRFWGKGKVWSEISEQKIIDILKRINPEYKITYYDSNYAKRDVMCAYD